MIRRDALVARAAGARVAAPVSGGRGRAAAARVAGAGLAVLLVGAVTTACSSKRLRPGEARLTVDGRAAVAGRDHVFRAVHGERVIHDGDQVRVDAGSARLALGRGGRLELRNGTTMVLADPVVLSTGDLLVEPDRNPVAVTSDDADVRVDNGAARVSRTLAFTVTAYRGTSVLGSPGSADLAVKAPRQAGVPARGVVPDQAVPASCDDDDPWSRRFLAAPCDLGAQLGSAGSGMVAQLPPGEGHTPGFFRLLVPSLEREPALDTVLDPARDPGDNLIASVIAVHATGGPSFAERWHAIFGFRDQGAVNWGLVALDQGVTDAGPLNGDLDQAIGRAPKRFATAFAATGTGGGAGGGIGGAGSGAGGSGAGASGAGGSGGGGSGSPGSPGPSSPGGGGPSTTTPTTSPLPTTPPVTLPAPAPSVPLPPPPGPPGSTTTSTSTPLDPILDPLVTTVSTLLGGILP